MGCKVAQHKSIIVASSDRLLKKLGGAFGKFAGTVAQSGSNLGVDYAPGRRRAHKKSLNVLRKRAGGFTRRMRRLGVLRRKGYDMQKLYVTGLQAYAFYGAEVVGLGAKQLKTAQANYLSLVGSPARSRSASVALAVAGDPLWRQGLGPVLTWASTIWKATTSASFQAFVSLPQLGALARPVVQALPRTWGGVRRPLGAAHMSLKRIGWTFATPLVLKSAEGQEFALTTVSPALLAYHLQVAWKKSLGVRAGKAVGGSTRRADRRLDLPEAPKGAPAAPQGPRQGLRHSGGLESGTSVQLRLRRGPELHPLRREGHPLPQNLGVRLYCTVTRGPLHARGHRVDQSAP